MNYYLTNRAIKLESIAKFFIAEYNLKPNFDIIKLLNDLSIKVKSLKLPKNLDYAFGLENNGLLIYFNENIMKTTKGEKENLEYKERNLRFILTQALSDILLFYQLDEQKIVKEEYEGNFFYKSISNSFLYFNQKEKETEYLASCLLMPQENLKEKFYKLVQQNNNIFSYNEIYKLGLTFGVNKDAIRQRCRVLNLIK